MADEKKDEWTVDMGLTNARELKAAGNALFKERKYEEAVRKYGKIALWVNHLDSGGYGAMMQDVKQSEAAPELKTEAKQLRISAYLNICMCRLHMKRYDSAMEYVQKALEVDKENKKAQMRRGMVAVMLGDLDTAENDIRAAKLNFPQDRLLAKYDKLLRKKQKKQALKQQRDFGGLFDAPRSTGQAVEASSASSSSSSAASSSSSAGSSEDVKDLVNQFL